MLNDDCTELLLLLLLLFFTNNKKRGRAGVLINLVMREEGRKFEKQLTHHNYDDRTLLLTPRQ